METTSSPPLDGHALATFYRAYIASINSGTISHDLQRFCHEWPTYNGRPLTRAAYQANIDAAFAHMPDVQFRVQLMTVDAEQQSIAARLEIGGTLTQPWPELGLDLGAADEAASEAKPGRRVVVYEHVFYALRDGRIDQVWTLITNGRGATIEP